MPVAVLMLATSPSAFALVNASVIPPKRHAERKDQKQKENPPKKAALEHHDSISNPDSKAWCNASCCFFISCSFKNWANLDRGL